NGIAIYGNNSTLDSAGGNFVVNAYAGNSTSYVINTPISLSSGSGSLALNVAGGNVAINQATLGNAQQSGDISLKIDTPT
ncbi:MULTISPECIES: hypothetical protein, partial [unclassified Caballeronia]|uniref:hypothetical protein n=1 Tax=unclassified Caballeronia TaxID=2646786 RepID=UPI0020284988